MRWLKEHGLSLSDTLIALADLILAYLAFYGFSGKDFPQFGPESVAQFFNNNKIAICTLMAVFVLLSLFRLITRAWRKSGRLSKADQKRIDEEFQSSFAKCPYWIKVFLKTVQDKNTVFSTANDFYFENYSQFLLQFVDYKTVSASTWQYSMPNDIREYFDSHSQLLGDVTEEEVCRHARRNDVRIVEHTSNEFYWWYYSDEDYIEPITWTDPSNPLMPR